MTASVITIKQLLSLDIIKARQNAEGGVNPPVAQRSKFGEGSRGMWPVCRVRIDRAMGGQTHLVSV